ncbi:hypothetical protein LEM8419_01377 [Neolewinella maritima]|uniref:Uncharacterized protein n=1 Tax=Neolewinella maritima TaxID=1383882 RepID=A0ABM9AZV5_9BACT|nr:hypothetical protein [Neolewinella maritima]CAH1000228.1 hypothetical protein LEM8419_01377 [Neolewinella maritima]
MTQTLFLLLLPVLLFAQDRVFTADLRFADGVYLDNDALLANTPDLSWDNIEGEMVQLPDDYRVQIDNFGYRAGTHDAPYAIVLDGLPYYFVREDAKRGYHEFAGLRTAGRYATLQYDTLVHSRQLMKAYNPATGQPFRQAFVERDRQRRLYRVLEVATGRRVPLDRPTVLRLIATEEDLVTALERAPVDDTARLLRALQLYNDRHPLYLSPPPRTH